MPPSSDLLEAVRALRRTIINWGVITAEQLLFSVAREPTRVRFVNTLPLVGQGLIETLQGCRCFPCKAIDTSRNIIATNIDSMRQGTELLRALMDVEKNLPRHLQSIPGEPWLALTSILEALRGDRDEWEVIDKYGAECECGTV